MLIESSTILTFSHWLNSMLWFFGTQPVTRYSVVYKLVKYTSCCLWSKYLNNMKQKKFWNQRMLEIFDLLPSTCIPKITFKVDTYLKRKFIWGRHLFITYFFMFIRILNITWLSIILIYSRCCWFDTVYFFHHF